jgi:uncharacterized protein (TIGR00297 family)
VSGSILLLLVIGAPLHLLGAVISFWRKSVDAGGAVVGAVAGTVIFVAAGPLLWLPFAAFVLSSTAFTRFRAERKERLAGILEKGSRRDMFQVLANGGVGMLMALLLRLTGEPAFALAFAASFASANADTWASEIGVLSPREPVSLITFRRVPRGTSGGVTGLGLAVSLCGALLVALLSALSSPSLADAACRVGFVTLAGVVGSILDSLLGCTIQARYSAPGGGTTERRFSEGTPNTLVRGLPFVTNDVVNLLSTAAAAVIGALFHVP